ncbi:hypothetical protein BVRB_3g054670 isoform B [Beta vulgaris subsp. vulgaris]|nr:hypothetical protein BVRB_3g054670 isoform B [Beta vulgaris subsp. vulgaris]
MYHYGSAVKDQEECLKLCVLREIGKDLTQLQERGGAGKKEENVDSAASVYGIVFRKLIIRVSAP